MNSILISGGSGSFGQAFVRRALSEIEEPPADGSFYDSLPPRWDRIIVFSRCEFKQSEMKRKFKPLDPDNRLRFFLGDVRDLPRLRAAMRGVDTVIHAAALKQVPALEYNPTEAIKTNVIGAMNVIEAATDCGVRRVLALSTDKATAPLNLYGATKLCAEKLFIAANAMATAPGTAPGNRTTAFSCVRYGNVTGSRGSVVPLWREVAESGNPLTLTDERMTRFWMTLDDAVDFVVGCLETMTGGQVFVPKLEAYRITDLAQAVAPTAGWVVTGIRPGEKLHESMVSEDEGRMAWHWALGWALCPEPTIDLAVSPPPGAQRVQDGFSFSSDLAEMLDVETLTKRLEDVD